MKDQTEENQHTQLTAAALKYDAEVDDAPVVVGLGQGTVAENMIKAAQDANIPVVEDQPLAGLLGKLSVGDEIPEELYRVVGEVLVFICRLDKGYEKRFGLSED